MKVLKFGGTSVANAENISKVIEILKSESKKQKIAVVVSALGGTTDTLIEAGTLATEKNERYLDICEQVRVRHQEAVNLLIKKEKQKSVLAEVNTKVDRLQQILKGIFLINEFSDKTRDKILSFGELLSSYIISEAAKEKIKTVALKDSRELIVTDSIFTQANVKSKTTNKNITDYFKSSKSSVTILPGFVSRNEDGVTTTLGRGGSDYTAALLAAALNTSILEIWTDVSGMFTANPKLVSTAFPIDQISYQEAMELSHFGAKVLYPPTVQPALRKNIPIVIKNTFEPEHKGTLITNKTKNSNGPVKGISHVQDIALLTLEGNGMVGIPGFSKRLFDALSREKVNVIMITQASSEHSICVGIHSKNSKAAKNVVDEEFAYERSLKKIKPLIVEDQLAIIAVVGDKMKSHQGISGRMFRSLGKDNVNVRAIAQGASERNISAVIDQVDVKKALNVLHERFFETETKQLNVFITGVGNVGERLIDQIQQQGKFLKENLQLDVRVVGISNSRSMFFNRNGIDLDNWVDGFSFSDKSSPKGFFEKVVELNLRNSIFVDVTANESIADMYDDYLKESIAVVACSKIACSGSYEQYKRLKRLSLKYNAAFHFETNVGAALPIINTLNNLVASGDKVTSIQAVLSGSLNFIFNNFSDRANFHDIVKRAQFEGYTEPDPRIDLSGIDVARKILILARENGVPMEIDDIEIKSFLTKANKKAKSVDDFYKTLVEDETYYQEIYASSKANNCQLKFVAEYNKGKAQIGLREIPVGHPFHNLAGKDNIVMFYTERYPEQPLIVKGAGAGAEVTASGLFADIIKMANY